MQAATRLGAQAPSATTEAMETDAAAMIVLAEVPPGHFDEGMVVDASEQETLRRRRRGLWIGILVCSIVFGPPVLYWTVGIIRFRSAIGEASSFCDTVARLPRKEIAAFASKCDALWVEKGGTAANATISDTNTLSRFSLAGQPAVSIYVIDHMVSVSYLREGRTGAMVQWTDYSQWGDPSWKLATRAGETGGGILYVVPKDHTVSANR